MQFLDEVEIEVKAGDGGDGAVAFRREKYVPLGGPSGGDGGRGGSVYLEVNPRLNTLLAFQHRKRLSAQDGAPGRNKNQTGRDGEDLVAPVPPGTVVRDKVTGALLADLVRPGQRVCVVQGGRGGKGNQHYATPRNQAPRYAQRGEPGAARTLSLELRLIADAGIAGVPNAGKSTLLSVVSAARPKIADYPFTTLQPNLGVARIDEERALVLADIPGLIAGAHAGIGLGHEFLRHIVRTRILIHLLDGAAENPLEDFRTVNEELRLFDARLAAKPQLVVLNKMDLPMARDRWPALRDALQAQGYEAAAISAVTGEGVRDMLFRAAALVEQTPPPAEAEPETITLASLGGEGAEGAGGYTIARQPDGAWRVRGATIERIVRRTNWDYDEAVDRFQRVLERLGLRQALEEAGVQEGDTVVIGDVELEWRD